MTVPRVDEAATMTWSSDRGFSGSGTIIHNFGYPRRPWVINEVPLLPGINTITVTTTDGSRTDPLSSSSTIVITLDQLTYFLAEGAASSFFTTEILLANPHDVAVNATMKFLLADGTTTTQGLTLAPQSRKTIRVNDLPGMAFAGGFSTIITSVQGMPIIVERTMFWDQRAYGSATDHASDSLSTTWYFAEGAQGYFRTYLLLTNPNDTANVAHVRYLVAGQPSFARDYTLAPFQRLTVDAGAYPELATQTFGISLTFDRPGVAERSMYFGSDPQWLGGHESGGMTSISTSWFLAEGATGSYFKTYILLANPTDVPTACAVNFLLPSGEVIPLQLALGGFGRTTIDIASVDPRLRNTAVATRVTTNSPIVVERSQYWPGGPDTWQEAHNSFGVMQPGTRWGLAEGRIGMDQHFQPYILVANPGSVAANVTIRFLREEGSGKAPFTRTFTVQPNSRYTIFGDAGVDVSPLKDESFGAVLTSDQPIVVERALYSDALGVHWQAGSNATATRLPASVQ